MKYTTLLLYTTRGSIAARLSCNDAVNDAALCRGFRKLVCEKSISTPSHRLSKYTYIKCTKGPTDRFAILKVSSNVGEEFYSKNSPVIYPPFTSRFVTILLLVLPLLLLMLWLQCFAIYNVRGYWQPELMSRHAGSFKSYVGLNPLQSYIIQKPDIPLD